MSDPNQKIPEFLIPQKYPKNEMKGKMDYDESSDIVRLHGAASREMAEPAYDGAKRGIPGWLTGIFCFLLFWSGSYLGAFSGGFKNDVFNDESGNFTSGGSKAGSDAPVVEKTPVELGEIVYKNICQACHQTNGAGVAGQFPPLAGSEYVLESERRMAMAILHGVHGPITVKGGKYNSQMQAWGPSLKDKQVANVMTYIRQAWGNAAPPVEEAGVKALRAELAARDAAYSEAELLAVPKNAPLPK